MNPDRYNSFNQVHKGLRAFLFDTAIRLQQSDLADQRSANVIDQIDLLVDSFEAHAYHEDHFFNEPLEDVRPDVAHLFEKEHQEDHRLGIVLKNQLEEWRNATNPDAKRIIGQHLFYTFNEFIAFNLYHMNKEEIVLNRVLWETYTDDQIRTTEQTLVQSVPPQKMMLTMKWMLRGINDTEIIIWMKGVQLNAPAPVYAILISMAEQELEPSRWSRIQKALHTRENNVNPINKAC